MEISFAGDGYGHNSPHTSALSQSAHRTRSSRSLQNSLMQGASGSPSRTSIPSRERDIDKLASWWHTDSDLGRELESVNDMTKSRLFGFNLYQDSRASFFELFDRLRREKIIPA